MLPSAARCPAKSGSSTPAAPWWVSAGAFSYFVGIGAQIPTFPSFVLSLPGGSVGRAGWLIATFSVFAILARLPILATRRQIPSKGLIVVGAALSAGGTALPLVSTALQALVATRALGGVGDAMFLTAASYTTLQGQAGGVRRFTGFTAVVNAAILLGPPVGEAARIHLGYQAVWILSSSLLLGGSIAAIGGSGERVSHESARRHAIPTGSKTTLVRILLLYLASSVPIAVAGTFGALAMRQAGADNTAWFFIAVSGSSIAIRVSIATGRLQICSSRTVLAMATVGSAGATLLLGSERGLVLAATVIGLAQGMAAPVFAREITEKVRPSLHLAATGLMTVALDLGFIIAGAALSPLASAYGLVAVFGVATLMTFGATVFATERTTRP